MLYFNGPPGRRKYQVTPRSLLSNEMFPISLDFIFPGVLEMQLVALPSIAT